MVNSCPSKRSGVRTSLSRAPATKVNMGLERIFSSAETVQDGAGEVKKPVRWRLELQQESAGVVGRKRRLCGENQFEEKCDSHHR